MPTKYDRTALIAQVEEFYDDLIKQVSDEVEKYKNGDPINEQRDAWRARAVKSIRDMNSRLNSDDAEREVTDYELGNFSIPEFRPRITGSDMWFHRNASKQDRLERLTRDLRHKEEQKRRAMALVRTLKGDEDDAIALSQADLKNLGLIPV